jgi:hypothetical protein
VTGSNSDPRDDEDGANSINLDALARLGPPSEPKPESKAAMAMRRFQGQALIWCLIAWTVFVVAVVLGKSLSNPGGGLQRLVLGGLAAVVGAIASVLAIRAKQSDHQAGREPATVMGVSWSTRFLLGGVLFMVIGTGIFLSVR